MLRDLVRQLLAAVLGADLVDLLLLELDHVLVPFQDDDEGGAVDVRVLPYLPQVVKVVLVGPRHVEGHHPAAGDLQEGVVDLVQALELIGQGAQELGPGGQLEGDLTDNGQGSLGAGDEAGQVVAGHVVRLVLEASVDDHAIGHDDLHVADVVAGRAVLVVADPDAVGGDPPGEGRARCAGRVRSEEEPSFPCSVIHLLPRASRLGGDGHVLLIDLQDLVHPAHHIDEYPSEGGDAPGQSPARGSPGRDRHAFLRRDLDHLGDVLDGAGADHDVRNELERYLRLLWQGGHVMAVQQPLPLAGLDVLGPNGRFQLVHDGTLVFLRSVFNGFHVRSLLDWNIDLTR